MKEFIKKALPFTIVLAVLREYMLDYFRYLRYSGIFIPYVKKQEKLIGLIVADYHVIEKGLTMSETRLGFGTEKINKLIKLCSQYINSYGLNHSQVHQGISVLNEYLEFHKSKNFSLNPELVSKIENLQRISSVSEPSKQIDTTAAQYFMHTASEFDKFAISRRSVRNYSPEKIDNNLLLEAVNIAQAAPSSCNRQSSRVHIYENPEQISQILLLQGGNRGFGHLANRLIVITAELGATHGVYEKNLAYVDGGIFAMSVLNALHFKKLLACPLNCYFSKTKERKLRKICNIPDSEVFVLMISCGHAPNEFKVAQSLRTPTANIISFK